MRHRVKGRQLNRTMEHREALRRNMVQSLIEHGEIRTTIPKAKEVRRFAEQLVTLAIDGSLPARQRAIALLNDRSIIRPENREDYDAMSDAKRARVLRSRSGRRYRASTTRPGVKFTAESVIHKLFAEVGPRMKRRNDARGCSGGYTRIIKLAARRLGDGGQLAILQLVGEDDAPRPKASDRTERKRRARVKYTLFAGKPIQRQRRRSSGRPAKAAAEKPAEQASTTPPAETTGAGEQEQS